MVIAIEKLVAGLPGPLKVLAQGLVKGDSEDRRSQRGAAAAFAIRVVSAAIAFLSQVFLARWLGAHEFGIFTYVWVWINVAGTLCVLGFSTSAVRFIPEYCSGRQFALARGFLFTGGALSIGVGAAAMVAGLAVLHAPIDVLDDHFRVPLAMGLLCLPAFALTDFQDGVGRARGWIDLALGPPYIIRPLLLLVFMAAAVASGWARDAETAVYGAVLATWLTASAQFLLQKERMLTTIPPGKREFRLPLWFKVSLPLLMLEGFSLLMTNLDILLLDLYVAPDQIALYFAAARTIALISFVHFAVTAVAMPRFSALAAMGDNQAIRQLLADMRRWTLWPSLLGAAVLLILGEPLLRLFGPEFTAAYPVMFVLVAGLIALAAAGPVQGLLVVTGHHNMTALILAVTVVLNAALNVALIPVWGLVGAATATSTALAFQALVLHLAAQRATAGIEVTPGRSHGTAAE